MSNTNTHNRNFNELEHGKDTKKDFSKQLFDLLHDLPMSRRMSATELGFPDQTYMVTQNVIDWLKNGKAVVVWKNKCTRSGRIVEFTSTNPMFFPISIQLNLF